MCYLCVPKRFYLLKKCIFVNPHSKRGHMKSICFIGTDVILFQIFLHHWRMFGAVCKRSSNGVRRMVDWSIRWWIDDRWTIFFNWSMFSVILLVCPKYFTWFFINSFRFFHVGLFNLLIVDAIVGKHVHQLRWIRSYHYSLEKIEEIDWKWILIVLKEGYLLITERDVMRGEAVRKATRYIASYQRRSLAFCESWCYSTICDFSEKRRNTELTRNTKDYC
jgi:hypothetical protein